MIMNDLIQIYIILNFFGICTYQILPDWQARMNPIESYSITMFLYINIIVYYRYTLLVMVAHLEQIELHQ